MNDYILAAIIAAFGIGLGLYLLHEAKKYRRKRDQVERELARKQRFRRGRPS